MRENTDPHDGHSDPKRRLQDVVIGIATWGVHGLVVATG